MASDNPIIIVPGVFGSSLENFYALEPEPTWSETASLGVALAPVDYSRIALDPSGSFDASLDVMTRANGLVSSAYEKLAAALRARRSAPVYLFPYDWRRSSAVSAVLLQRFVELVRAKMASVPGWSGRVDFVTHSFGGLVFRAYLGLNHLNEQIGQVVFLAVPHRGTLDAAEAMIRGRSFLLSGRNEVRKVARTFPSLYELLPTFPGAVVGANGANLSLFDLRNWQENVTASGRDGPERNGYDVSQERLDAARVQHAAWRQPTDVVAARDMLTIYGSDPGSTLVAVNVQTRPDVNNWYDFGAAERGTGDGIVPERSALLGGIPAIRLSLSDASPFLEARARLISLHAFIATLDEVQTIVGRFLQGRRDPEDLLPRNLPLERYGIPVVSST